MVNQLREGICIGVYHASSLRGGITALPIFVAHMYARIYKETKFCTVAK